MIRLLIFIFCLSFGLNSFGSDEIDYQNKRILNQLKKNGISDFSELKEVVFSSEKQIKPSGKFFKVVAHSDGSKVHFVFVGRVYSCRTGGCCNESEEKEYQESEYFDYFMFFDSSKTVRYAEVYNYQATHGYEVTAKGWLKQFVGYSGNESLIVNKDIDGISGATISVFAITADVQEKTRLLKSLN